MISCSCGHHIESEWKYCPKCGLIVNPSSPKAKPQKLAIVGLLMTVAFSLSIAFGFREKIFGKPVALSPTISNQSQDRLFQQFLATGNTNYLFDIVDSLIKRKPSELSQREKLMLVDSLTALSKAYPNDYDIKFNLGLASFLFGAYSKSEEIFLELQRKLPERKDVTALAIASIIGAGEYDRALAEIQKSTLSEDQKQFLQKLLFSKKNREEIPEPRDGKEAAILEAFKTSGIASNPATPVIKWLHSHPVVGDKIISHAVANGILRIELSNFPVDQMPESIKERFIAKIKELIKPTNLTAVELFEKGRLILEIKR